MSLVDFYCNCVRYKKKETAQWIHFVVKHMIVFHFRFSKTGFDSKNPISFNGLWIRHRVNSLFFKQLERGVNVKGDSYTVSSINYEKKLLLKLYFSLV